MMIEVVVYPLPLSWNYSGIYSLRLNVYIQSSSQGNIKRKDGQWTRKEKAQLIILSTYYINDSKIKNQSNNPYQFEPKILYPGVGY